MTQLRILIATVRIPFVEGGAEILAANLQRALLAVGHQVETVAVPFQWNPPERIVDQMMACRLLDISEAGGVPVDLVIGLKFPAYLIPHPRKVLWVLHQHRQAYDLWDHPSGDLHYYSNGDQVRQAIREADTRLISQVRAAYGISQNVVARMKTYCGISAQALYHPPNGADLFYSRPPEEFLYFPSRINPMKRQDLVLRALTLTRYPVKAVFSGACDDLDFGKRCEQLREQAKLSGRVQWLGPVSEEQKRDLYARCMGVVFPPIDEDYGYITLEGMLAGKPVITCTDSGGPLEFVIDHQTGLITDPEPEALAAAMDELWGKRGSVRIWGAAARQRYQDMQIGWDHVIQKLTA